MTRIALIAILFASSMFTRLTAGEPTWKAGVGVAIITPQRPMWMSGYAARSRPAEGKVSDLYAKALLLEDPRGDRAVLVTLDLVGIDREFSVKLAKAIAAAHAIPRERIMLTVSHTHCGPVVGKNLGAMYFYDDAQAKLVAEYADQLHDLILKAVAEASQTLAPVRLASGRGQATFAVNRRTNAEGNVAALREAGQLRGPVDHDVPVLAVRDVQNKLRAVVFGYACHATTLDFYQWCADWPGFAQTDIEAAHPGAIALFWAGCGADQNPLPRRSLALARKYGQELAQSVEAVLKAPMTPIPGKLQAHYSEIDLPFADLPSREKLAQDMLDTNKFIASRAKLLMHDLATRGPLKAAYPYPIQTWRLGDDLTWLALGGEVVVDYSLRLKKDLGPLWCTAYANDVMAYIPSRRVLKEGGYEGAANMIYYGQPASWNPRIEDLIVDEATRQIRSSK